MSKRERPPARTAAPALATVMRSMLASGVLLLTMGTKLLAQDIDHRAMEQIFGEAVTDSATGKPQRASEVPANMEIVTQDDIRRSGATNISDVLRFVSGVDVRVYGMASADVGIRGFNQAYNPRLLVLVNGRQVYNDDYGHVVWSTIPVQLEEIRQIEIIKGPNSALYGFNAVSGVVNIITYNPLFDSINTATVRGGSQDYGGGSAVATARAGESAGLRLSLGGFQSRDFLPGNLPASEAAVRQSPLVGAFNIDGRARIAPGVETFLEASMANGRLSEDSLEGGVDTSYSRSNSLRAGISAETPIGVLGFDAYRNEELVSIGAPGLENLAASLTQRVYVVQASDLVKLGADHTVRIGLEYRNNSATSPGFFAGTIGYEVYAGSLMWVWRMSPKVSVTNAVRVDNLHLNYAGTPAFGSGLTSSSYNGAGFTAFSFNSGLVYQPTDRDTVRLLAARGIQAPSLVDFGLQIPVGTVGPAVVAGSPNVQPTIVYNLELDYDRALPAIGSLLRTAVFAQHNENIISEPFSTPPAIGPAGLPLLLSANVGDVDAIGAEIGIRGHADPGLRWNLSYSLVVTRDNTSLNSGPTPTSAVDYDHSVPRHVVVAGIGYTHDRLEADLMARWQSSYRDFASTGSSTSLQTVEIANYLLVNGRIGYRLTDNFTVAATVQQFNNSRLLQTAGPPVERRAIVSVNVHF